MDWAVIASIAVPVVVAVAGFFAAYLNNLRLARRKDRLERVNRQLSEFYGPLLALVSTTTATWDVFRSTHRPNQTFWDPATPPTEAEATAWRLWVAEVFMPLNIRIEELIVSKADLLDSTSMPPFLLDLTAHISSLRALLAAWNCGDTSVNTAPLAFPREEVMEYAKDTFAKLKDEQQQLLGALAPASPPRSADRHPFRRGVRRPTRH